MPFTAEAMEAETAQGAGLAMAVTSVDSASRNCAETAITSNTTDEAVYTARVDSNEEGTYQRPGPGPCCPTSCGTGFNRNPRPLGMGADIGFHEAM